jgi:hypothetical protein
MVSADVKTPKLKPYQSPSPNQVGAPSSARSKCSTACQQDAPHKELCYAGSAPNKKPTPEVTSIATQPPTRTRAAPLTFENPPRDAPRAPKHTRPHVTAPRSTQKRRTWPGTNSASVGMLAPHANDTYTHLAAQASAGARAGTSKAGLVHQDVLIHDSTDGSTDSTSVRPVPSTACRWWPRIDEECCRKECPQNKK